jgi:hypothetical protein
VAAVMLVPSGRSLARELAYDARLHGDLPIAIAAAGGPQRLRDCGHLAVGNNRFPLAAWHLGVHISRLDDRARTPGVVLRSRLRAGAAPAPAVPPALTRVGGAGAWEVFARC